MNSNNAPHYPKPGVCTESNTFQPAFPNKSRLATEQSIKEEVKGVGKRTKLTKPVVICRIHAPYTFYYHSFPHPSPPTSL